MTIRLSPAQSRLLARLASRDHFETPGVHIQANSRLAPSADVLERRGFAKPVGEEDNKGWQLWQITPKGRTHLTEHHTPTPSLKAAK